MAQAPNTYPKWLAPKAPVTLAFSEKLLTVFTNHYLEIRTPAARIRYRIVDPANYEFHWTNQWDQARGTLELSFGASIDRLPERTNQWTAQPRGTVVLVHGYGVSGFTMLPWAFLLAQQGWRCVLVDLRGHGKSTGKQIYFGLQEVADLQAVLDQLEKESRVTLPVSVVGHSFGAVLALRWKMTDSHIDRVVAIAPYARLSLAVLSITREYAPWLPRCFIKAGLRELPNLLKAQSEELDPAFWLPPNQKKTFFIAGERDRITPSSEVERMLQFVGAGNKFLIVPNASHEALPFYLDDLAGPIANWLSD